MLVVSDAVNAEQSHGREAEWEIQSRESQVHAQRGPAIFAGQFFQPRR